MKKECFFVIPAGGAGTRMKSAVPKLLLEIDGKPVIIRTLDAVTDFLKDFETSLIAISASDDMKAAFKQLLVPLPSSEFLSEKFSFADERDEFLIASYNGIPVIAAGSGDNRTSSVAKAVDALTKAGNIFPNVSLNPDSPVIIHDGARCLVCKDEFEGVYSGILATGICAACVPVKSTLKFAEQKDDGILIATSTPDRASLREVLTPQGFKYKLLEQCYSYAETSKVSVTDDTALAEILNLPVQLSEGRYSNIKITTPEDIVFAESILKEREEQISTDA